MAWSILMSDADISSQTLAYTVPAGKEGRLSVEFTNRNAAATATVQMWVVPSAESVGNEHLKEPGTNLSIAGTAQSVLTRKCVVAVGDKVYVQASNANVSCQVSGDVVSPDTFGVTDGTSGIVYGTNWSVFAGQVSLKKDQNGQVSLNLSAQALGAPGGVVATLPSGYRPSVTIEGAPGAIVVGDTYYPAYWLVLTNGALTVTVLPTSLGLSASSGSLASINVSFFV